MVAAKVRDLRQNRNRDDLVHSQLRANKETTKIAPGGVDGHNAGDVVDPLATVLVPTTPSTIEETGNGNGKGKGKPDRPCYHHLNGSCRRGDECKFWHPEGKKAIAKLKSEDGFVAWLAKGAGKGGKSGDESSDVEV